MCVCACTCVHARRVRETRVGGCVCVCMCVCACMCVHARRVRATGVGVCVCAHRESESNWDVCVCVCMCMHTSNCSVCVRLRATGVCGGGGCMHHPQRHKTDPQVLQSRCRDQTFETFTYIYLLFKIT